MKTIIGAVLPRQDHRFPKRWMTLEGRLDFSQFDTETTDLDLMIASPLKLQIAVVQLPRRSPSGTTAPRAGCRTGRE